MSSVLCLAHFVGSVGVLSVKDIEKQTNNEIFSYKCVQLSGVLVIDFPSECERPQYYWRPMATVVDINLTKQHIPNLKTNLRYRSS